MTQPQVSPALPKFSRTFVPICHNCQDRGWVNVEPGQPSEAKHQPCFSCQPDAYKRFWAALEVFRKVWFNSPAGTR